VNAVVLAIPLGIAIGLDVGAIAAAVGAGALALRGHVCWRIALTFTVPAAAGSLLGTFASREVSGKVLILAFVPVMLVASRATWQRAAHVTARRSAAVRRSAPAGSRWRGSWSVC
jgi:uncharacterized membrane protein YfcA